MTDPDGRYYGNVCQWKLKLTYLICINLSSFMNQTRTVSLQKKSIFLDQFPAGIYLLKANNRNSRTRCEICSPERRHWLRSGVFIDNF